jgi:hypothetical protein
VSTQTQTRPRVHEGLLSVVLRPDSEAASSYRSEILAPGFGPESSLDLRFFGGKTLPQLRFSLLYPGAWTESERSQLDDALSAAMRDRDLNNMLAQYFPGAEVTATFGGSRRYAGAVPKRVTRKTVETFVTELSTNLTVTCLCLPKDAVLVDTVDVDSKHGLAGYHGSVHVDGKERYYCVAVYSEGDNGIVAFDEPWKNVCATLYHELQETRTDPDVEDAIRLGSSPNADRLLGWYSPRGGEIGDIPLSESGARLDLVMQEVPLADGSGTVPIQLMWSNAVAGPEGPVTTPRRPR